MSNIKHLFKAMFWFGTGFFTAMLASCSFDDGYGSGGEGTASLQLSITAREERDLNSRDVVEEGNNKEYMHNLCVLLVNENNEVVRKFLPQLETNTAAQAGNLKSWGSAPFTLPVGRYTVYAFANVDTYYNGLWGSLTGLPEGESLADWDIDGIVLDGDPASKLDFTNFFIPMSARQEVEVTEQTRSISIGLDRLVSKVRMAIAGKADTEITGFTFGGYADQIGLFPETALGPTASFNLTKNVSLSADGSNGIRIPNNGSSGTGILYLQDFYVNATPASHPFTVTVVTNEPNGVVYKATTERNELPRNSIYPLTLQLNDYGLDLQAQCWLSPIGSFPVEVKPTVDLDTYEITVPEGCQFAFTLAGIREAQTSMVEVTGLNATWDMPDGVSGILFDGATDGVTTVEGHVTAAAGRTFNLTALVTWTYQGVNYERTYTIVVHTADMANFLTFNISNRTRSAEFCLDYLRPEMLNLFKY